jgi:hypothetical protein
MSKAKPLCARTLRAVARWHHREAQRYDLNVNVGAATDATRSIWRRVRDEHSIIKRRWQREASAIERKAKASKKGPSR